MTLYRSLSNGNLKENDHGDVPEREGLME